jgi:hypothetical protein
MTYEEMILKAKEAKSAEELLALAKEYGMELTEESAKAYFEQLHNNGELSDDELDSVTGGGCSTSGGYTVVSSGLNCFITDPDGTPGYTSNFSIVYDTQEILDGNGSVTRSTVKFVRDSSLRRLWYNFCCDPQGKGGTCGSCQHLEFDGGTGYCGKTKK